MITLYNAIKGGVDLVELMSGTFYVGRTRNRWPVALFFNLLNISCINNSFIIYNSNNNINIK